MSCVMFLPFEAFVKLGQNVMRDRATLFEHMMTRGRIVKDGEGGAE